jgi:hypothetical protein
VFLFVSTMVCLVFSLLQIRDSAKTDFFINHVKTTDKMSNFVTHFLSGRKCWIHL